MASNFTIPPDELSAAIEGGRQIQAFKSFYLAGLTILWFDYILTVGDEWRYFWKQRKTILSYVFFTNRYYTLAAYIVATAMFFAPAIHGQTCVRIGEFLPFGTGIPTLIISALLMTARVYALYGRDWRVAAGLCIYLTAQVAATLWAFLTPGSGPLQLPPIPLDAYQVCIELTSPALGNAAVVWLAMECGFDTIVVTLTVIRSYTRYYHKGGHIGLIKTMVMDGVLYFLVIISFNTTWMAMVIAAAPGLKWICAMPGQALLVTMVNRITLHLRAQVYSRDDQRPTGSGIKFSNGKIDIPLDNQATIIQRAVHRGIESTSDEPDHIYKSGTAFEMRALRGLGSNDFQ